MEVFYASLVGLLPANPEWSLIPNWIGTFLDHFYNPRCLHQQDDVHAGRWEIAGWLLQSLAPRWVLQVRVWNAAVVQLRRFLSDSQRFSNRYLRFFPDGQVIMLTTPDEPLTVVHRLRTMNTRYSCFLSAAILTIMKSKLECFLRLM